MTETAGEKSINNAVANCQRKWKTVTDWSCGWEALFHQHAQKFTMQAGRPVTRARADYDTAINNWVDAAILVVQVMQVYAIRDPNVVWRYAPADNCRYQLVRGVRYAATDVDLPRIRWDNGVTDVLNDDGTVHSSYREGGYASEWLPV